jgi:hypothetical protein
LQAAAGSSWQFPEVGLNGLALAGARRKCTGGGDGMAAAKPGIFAEGAGSR